MNGPLIFFLTIKYEIFWSNVASRFLGRRCWKNYNPEYREENLDNLFDILDGGIEEGEFCPEDEFPEYEGSFNLEYMIIKDDGEQVYKDEDFDISKLEE